MQTCLAEDPVGFTEGLPAQERALGRTNTPAWSTVLRRSLDYFNLNVAGPIHKGRCSLPRQQMKQ